MDIDGPRAKAHMVDPSGDPPDLRCLTLDIEIKAIAMRPWRPFGAARAVSHLLVESDPGPSRTSKRLALDQRHTRLTLSNINVEHRAANAEHRGRRPDLVGPLIERAGRETEHALG